MRDTLSALDARHAKRVREVRQQHEWELASASRAHDVVREALAREQLRECETFAERVQQGLVTGGVVEQQVYSCNCANRYACRHNRLSTGQAQRRRPNREVTELRAAAEKLRARRRYADADELAARAAAIDERERAAWCEALKQRQIGSLGGDSAMARLVARHEAARAALEERQGRAIETLRDKHASILQTMPIALEAERRRVQQAVRKDLMQGKFDTYQSAIGEVHDDDGDRAALTAQDGGGVYAADAHTPKQRPATAAAAPPLATLPEGGSLVTFSKEGSPRAVQLVG